MTPTLQSALVAAVAGFLSRPCCVIPAALSIAGVSSAGVATVVMSQRPLFLASSVVCLSVSAWLTFRREGGWFNRTLAVAASVAAFLISAGYMGVLDVL
jgi:hypothetical protein